MQYYKYSFNQTTRECFYLKNFFEKINPKTKIKKVGEKYEMLKYTTRYVNIVSLLITIIIFISINLITPLFNKINKYPISNLFKKNYILVELKSNSNINQDT